MPRFGGNALLGMGGFGSTSRYVVEFSGRAIVSSFYKKTGAELTFRSGFRDASPERIITCLITAIAEVMMVVGFINKSY